MSLGSDVGASAAAGEIVKFIDDLIEGMGPDLLAEARAEHVLKLVKKRAQKIKEAAACGWY